MVDKEAIRELKVIIKKEQKRSFTEEDVLNVCDGKANLITYPQIIEYETLDDLMGPHEACIILYMTREDYGHWVCIFKKSKNIVEFFDPYGGEMKPDAELKFASKQFRDTHNENYPYLTKLMYESGYDIDYNDYKLQKRCSDTATCGRWVGARIMMRDTPLKDFYELFRSDRALSSDDKVTILTIFV